MTDTRSAEAIVYDLLPLHGPYAPDRTVRAGYLIDELLRYLNYATGNAEALPYPASLFNLVGALKTSADKLPQALQQSGQRLRQFSSDPTFIDRSTKHCSSPDAAAAAHESATVKAEHARIELQRASGLARELSRQLETVQGLLGSLGMQLNDDEDIDDDER